MQYKEGVLVGYRHHDANAIPPAYPFGHGLSYTTFSFARPSVTESADAVTLTVGITNTGDRSGYAVPQVYVGLAEPRPGVVMPPRQLKGAEKVLLQPGETRDVTITLDRRAFSYWDTTTDGWQVVPGCATLDLATSSREVVHQPAGAVRLVRAGASGARGAPGGAAPARGCRRGRRPAGGAAPSVRPVHRVTDGAGPWLRRAARRGWWTARSA